MPEPDSARIWTELSDEQQIVALMEVFGDFHDGCVREIHVSTDQYVDRELNMHFDRRTTVHMLVQRQFSDPSAIELRFEEVVALRVSPPRPNYDAVIMDAACLLRDGILYWADDGRWTPESQLEDCTWVAARRGWWRDASEWLGPDLRYRQDDA